MPKKVKKIIKKRKKINKQGELDLNLFYKTLNDVQINKKTSKVLVKAEEVNTYDNILKDLNLIYNRKPKKDQMVEYTITYNPEVEKDALDFDNIESLPDEFFDDENLFGI